MEAHEIAVRLEQWLKAHISKRWPTRSLDDDLFMAIQYLRSTEAVQPYWVKDLYSVWCEWSGGHITDRHFAASVGEIISDKCSPTQSASEGKE